MKLKRKNILLITLTILILLLGSILALKKDSILLLNNYLIYLSEANPLVERSEAQVLVEGDKLKINFKVSNQDQGEMAKFINNLGVSDQFLQGIVLSLDSSSSQKLAQILPAELNLDVTEKRLGFSNRIGPSLKSSFVKSDIDFATESSKFIYKANSDQDFYLEAIDPLPLVKYATSSGMINLSEKFSGLFPSLKSLSKIQLTVNGKIIDGEIVLK